MMSTEQMLENAAKDGSPPEEWQRVQEMILIRLESIVKSDFPSPQLKLDDEPSNRLYTEETQQSTQSSQAANKENDPPLPTSDPTLSSTIYSSLPPPLLSLINSITKSLTSNFADKPPHTMQRLAELILRPRAHYRYLGPYLNALDRVVSVQSPTTRFPLPTGTLPAASEPTFLQNGDNSSNPLTLVTSASGGGLGSDESLGGALLTPIPWLRSGNGSNGGSGSAAGGEIKSESTETIDGPNGAGRVETVSVTLNGVSSTSPTSPSAQTVSPTTSSSSATDQMRNQGAVTQGELLRQEQEAGVVPVAQMRRTTAGSATGAGGGLGIEGVEGVKEAAEGEEGALSSAEEQQVPHARGPEEIGMEDMGPQGRAPGSGLDMEAAVGRTRTEEKKDEDAAEGGEEGGEAVRKKEDEDYVMVDAPKEETAKDEL